MGTGFVGRQRELAQLDDLLDRVRSGGRVGRPGSAVLIRGRRRVAVINNDGRLLGLLCLKASQAGFCSDQDVRARAGKAGPALRLRGAGREGLRRRWRGR